MYAPATQEAYRNGVNVLEHCASENFTSVLLFRNLDYVNILCVVR